MSLTAHCERCGQAASEWASEAQLWLCMACHEHYQQLAQAGQELQATLQPALQHWWNRWMRRGVEGRDLGGQLAIVFEQLTESVTREPLNPDDL